MPRRCPTALLLSAAMLLPAALLLTGCATSQSDGVVVPPAAVMLPKQTFRLADFGASGDGSTDDTAAFTSAIAAIDAAGGGRLDVGPGRYLIGPIKLVSNLELHLQDGATILAMNDLATYPKSRAKYFKNEVRYTDLITADSCENIAITGEGTIDGQGAVWWARYRKPKKSATQDAPATQPEEKLTHRPNLIVLSGCQRVLVQGVTLRNSPMFHLIPQGCDDVTIDGVTISAPENALNTDGIDPSGHRIKITRCQISTGDDNIAIKPQRPPSWPTPSVSPVDPAKEPWCTNIEISDCHFGTGHGLSIGGQTTDGLAGLSVHDCTFDGTTTGIRLKAGQGSGGPVTACHYARITMKNVKTAVLITSYYPSIPKDPATMPAGNEDKLTPKWADITIDHLTATGSTEAGGLIGLQAWPIMGVRFNDVHIEAKRPMRIVDAEAVNFENSSIRVPGGPGVVATRADVRGIDVGAWTGAIAPITPSGAPGGTDENAAASQPVK